MEQTKDVDRPEDMILSKSRVKTYMNCPRQFRLKYIDRIRYEAGVVANRGRDVHSIIEEVNKLNSGDFDKEEKHIIDKYPQYELEIKSYFGFLRVLAQEFKIDYVKPQYSEEDITDPSRKIRGIIDAIFSRRDGLVIDFKTGKLRNIKYFRTELAIYAYLFEKRYGKFPKWWGIYFVDAKEFAMERSNRRQVASALKLFEKVRDKIANNLFPMMPSIPCTWCSYCGKDCEGAKRNKV